MDAETLTRVIDEIGASGRSQRQGAAAGGPGGRTELSVSGARAGADPAGLRARALSV